ncbi:MAG: methyltransferase domain-containing protein [Candidatus Pacearchaeota archaeon]
MNKITSKRAKLSDVLKVKSNKSFHTFFFENSLSLYQSTLKNKKDFGSVLALGANEREAEELVKYPFSKIVLSGITSVNEKIKEVIRKDKRVLYVRQNIEKISFKEGSFDLVFVKEAIHHVARPVLGLYEMLRVAKKGVIFIEPQESLFGNIFDKFGLTSQYEKNQIGNLKFRDNFVYRWRKKEIIKLLNSYYLNSGYNVYFKSCWMSNRYNLKFESLIRLLNFLGWLISFIPGNKGNYLICFIVPGKDLPK